ncbi:MAG: undecaprenyl-diphosphate phosphatase [Chloroflexota bacterium]|nr:undecaprenyl-diphosphate phosphatase [Chloroflexota bacterium]
MVLGAVQGITEFLPISSSGHLILVPWAADWDSPLLTGLTFAVAVHLGTGVAAFATLARQWRELLLDARDAAGNARQRLAAIVVGTAGVGIIAVLAESSIETVYREPWIVALALILGGSLLWAADRNAGPADTSPAANFLPWLVIAFSQVVAFIPGVSRSGITMTTARFLGIARVPAAIFSFQLMAPIILGAALWRGRDLFGGATSGADLAVLAVGALTSAVTGFLAARLLLAFLARNGFGPFALYRAILGVVALAFFFSRL